MSEKADKESQYSFAPPWGFDNFPIHIDMILFTLGLIPNVFFLGFFPI